MEMTDHIAEISVQGQWVTVPALRAGDTLVIIKGRLVRVAEIHNEEWAEDELDDPTCVIESLRQQRSGPLHADVFTFSQKPTSTAPKYTYWTENESVAAIPLASFKSWWEGLPQVTRKNVRRAEKRGVTIHSATFGDDLIRAIVDVNNDSPIRQGRRFTHYRKSFEQVKKDYSELAARSDFLCARLGDEPVGFAQVVYRGKVASILQLTPKHSHSDARPANALMAKLVEMCEARGASWITYGHFNYANKGKTPIREFKERNGFHEVLVPRYYVPLTLLGRVYVHLRLYRGIKGFLPRALLQAFVGLRARLLAARSV